MRPLIGLESHMTSNEHKVVYPGPLRKPWNFSFQTEMSIRVEKII